MASENNETSLCRIDFNSVIEGSYHDDWFKLYYKLAKLDVSEDSTVIDDGTYKYRLYRKVNDTGRNLETKVDTLGFCPGVVLPYTGGIPFILERPRAVCMRDGRLYIAEDMLLNPKYVDTIPMMVCEMGNIFSYPVYNELFDAVLRGVPPLEIYQKILHPKSSLN